MWIHERRKVRVLGVEPFRHRPRPLTPGMKEKPRQAAVIVWDKVAKRRRLVRFWCIGESDERPGRFGWRYWTPARLRLVQETAPKFLWVVVQPPKPWQHSKRLKLSRPCKKEWQRRLWAAMGLKGPPEPKKKLKSARPSD